MWPAPTHDIARLTAARLGAPERLGSMSGDEGLAIEIDLGNIRSNTERRGCRERHPMVAQPRLTDSPGNYATV
jgi:hypothetical protein